MHKTIIDANKKSLLPNFRELYQYRDLFLIFNMAGVVQGFRWAMFGGEAPGNMIYISVGMILIIFITGLLYFRKVEDEMADYV
jgi:ABC-type polysaccharide/polyol phosphate export permease